MMQGWQECLCGPMRHANAARRGLEESHILMREAWSMPPKRW